MTTLHSDRSLNHRQTPDDLFIDDLHFQDGYLHVQLKAGAEVVVPLWWYPRLEQATTAQRAHWELCAGGRGVHWPDIDEDLDAHGFVYGLKAPDAKPPKAH